MAGVEHVPQGSRAKSCHTASEIPSRPAFLKKKNQLQKKSAVSCVIDLMRSAVQHSVSNQGRNCRSTGKINSTVVLLLADRAVITGMAWQDEQS